MKKFLAFLLAALMVLPCVAFAAELPGSVDDLEFNREITTTVADWVGEWKLVGAYVSEDIADEYSMSFNGVMPLDVDVTMTIDALLDASATGSDLGVMVDVAQYLHAHVYDLAASIAFPEGVVTLKSAWDEWPNFVIRGEGDGDFNFGPAKTHVKGDDDTICFWTELTGIEGEDLEEMKYIGLTTDGFILLCYSDDNVSKKNGDFGYGYIFAKAE